MMIKELTKKEVLERLHEAGMRKINRPYTQRDIANALRLSSPHISMVIAGRTKSARVVDFISLLIGEPIRIKYQSQQRKQHLNLT